MYLIQEEKTEQCHLLVWTDADYDIPGDVIVWAVSLGKKIVEILESNFIVDIRYRHNKREWAYEFSWNSEGEQRTTWNVAPNLLQESFRDNDHRVAKMIARHVGEVSKQSKSGIGS
ncbi:hypothetical protein ACX27_04125 [Nostoc piscinale CENA21]|uniref:Uncharacterized protein n=1 Tax=Nostoc piscinale CENA21 TaxID=224013 RepID=A0A0M4SUW7_9NOSO|nr:hypothetical protein [Nostoc piscinale]ALF52221.1 hypothetical protein ACX27_04125 [Nostoc piscinale CENA21]